MQPITKEPLFLRVLAPYSFQIACRKTPIHLDRVHTATVRQAISIADCVLMVFVFEPSHQKCKACYKQLKNLSDLVKNKADQVGRHGSAFKELQLLMAPLDY